MGRLRNALIGVSVYLCCCLVATILLDTLICQPISDNWYESTFRHCIFKTDISRSIPNQLKSVWNSYTAFVVQWVLNWSTDLVAFLYPFFLLKHISLRKEQKLALIGVFSLGAITLSVSLARFVAYNATDFELEDESGSMSIQSTIYRLRNLTEYQISCLLPKWLQALSSFASQVFEDSSDAASHPFNRQAPQAHPAVTSKQ